MFWSVSKADIQRIGQILDIDWQRKEGGENVTLVIFVREDRSGKA